MTILTELEYRITKALDFLANLRTTDGKLIGYRDNKGIGASSLSVHLQAVSTLLYGGLFGQQVVIDAAESLMESVDRAVFRHKEAACIISDESSSTIGNALSVLIASKRDRAPEVVAFARSLLECVTDKSVLFFYSPGTKESEVSKKRLEHACGFVSLALLRAHQVSGDRLFLSKAHSVIGIAMNNGRFDHLDLWAMKLVGPNQEYENRVSHLITTLNSRAIEQLPVMTAAMVLMSNLAWPKFSLTEKNEALLRHIFSHQDNSGSFTIDKDHDEFDTLAIIRATNAMLLFWSNLTYPWKTHPRLCGFPMVL